MKKQLPTHNDEPSIKPAPKVLKVEEPNYEGEVKQGKYEVEEHISIHTDTQPQSKSTPRNSYPFDDIDIYAVDTRIWDRMSGMGGDGGGPHTHNEYADAQTLADHLANHPEGEGSYDDTELRGRVEQNETNISTLGSDLTSAEQNIQANTDALANKADADHTHEQEDILVFAHRFENRDANEAGGAYWFFMGNTGNNYYFQLNKTDADGEAVSRPQQGPCDILVKVGETTLRLVELTQVGDGGDSFDVWCDAEEATLLNEQNNGEDVFWDGEEVSGVPEHNHAGTYWGFWRGTQAEYDALGTYEDTTLYAVVG